MDACRTPEELLDEAKGVSRAGLAGMEGSVTVGAQGVEEERGYWVGFRQEGPSWGLALLPEQEDLSTAQATG